MPCSSWHVRQLEGEHASSQPPNPLQDLAVPLPAASPRRSTSLSSLTSFSSSMSIFQPTPPLDPASPPMPIPDTFDLDFDQDAKPAPAPAWPQTPPPPSQIPQTTLTTPPRPTVRIMPATPPPSATRSSKSKKAPFATPSRPAARPMPSRPTRATTSRARARPALNASPCPRGRRRSPAARQHQEDATEAALRDENRALRRAKWALENTNALLRARLLTCAEQVRHARAVEAQLDHAQRYVRALQKQVRSLGGFVVRLGGSGGGGGGGSGRGGDEDEDDGDDGDNGDNGDNEAGGGDSGDDGELPAAYVPEYFPDAARHPHKYTMLEMQREKALGKKTKPKLKN